MAVAFVSCILPMAERTAAGEKRSATGLVGTGRRHRIEHNLLRGGGASSKGRPRLCRPEAVRRIQKANGGRIPRSHGTTFEEKNVFLVKYITVSSVIVKNLFLGKNTCLPLKDGGAYASASMEAEKVRVSPPLPPVMIG